MPLPEHINDREYQKFAPGDNPGETKVRITGEFTNTDPTPPGFSAILYTPIDIDDSSWTLFTSGLNSETGSVGLQNDSGAELRFRHENTESDYIGWRILNNGEVFFDLETTAVVYVKASPGAGTRTIGRLELIK